MGKPERKIRERFGSSRSYLLRCFGISRKIHSDKPKVETKQEKKKKTRSTHWLFRSLKPRLKNDKNIPATIYETEKQKSNVEDGKQNLFRVMIRHDQKNMAANGYKTVEQETKEKYMNEERDINPDPLSFLGYDTCNEEEEKTTVECWKPDPTSKTVGSRSKSKSSRIRKGSRVGSFDPLIGILIIMVTLMIMLMWGRLCAIICTSTWCYFLPRLKNAAVAKCKRGGGSKAEEGGSFPSDLELNSEAYKKKVVLEGFLLRQHRV